MHITKKHILIIVIVATVAVSSTGGFVAFSHFQSADIPPEHYSGNYTLIEKGTVVQFIGFHVYRFRVPLGNFTVVSNGSWSSTQMVAEYPLPSGKEIMTITPTNLPNASFYNVTTWPYFWTYNGYANFTTLQYFNSQGGVNVGYAQYVSFVLFSPISTSLTFDQSLVLDYPS